MDKGGDVREYKGMMKYIVGIVAVLFLAIVGYYAWVTLSVRTIPQPEPVQQEPMITTSTYATSTFSIQYPSNFILNTSYTYDQFAGKPIAGVKFTIPASIATGTNLSALDTGISVEWLPRAQKCAGDIFIVPNVKSIDFTVGSTTYSVASTTEAAAGNRYEEMIFAIKNSKPCTAVRYFIHYGDINNYPQTGEGSVREFDRAALIRALDEIRNSLTLTR